MTRPLLPLLLGSAAAFVATLVSASPAAAQLHFDVGGQFGVARRALTNKTAGGPDAGFGPIGELRAHLALYPLVRLGAYLEHDISPISGGALGPARQITAGGLHAKILFPLPQGGKLRGYLGLGFGYAGVYAPSYHSASTLGPGGTMLPDIFVEGSKGSFWEIPLSIGGAYRIAKHVDLTAELGLRLGFDFAGDVYNGRVGHAAGQPLQDVEFPGNDSFATTLTLGVLFDL